jgi:hypothetical protein
VPVSSVMCSDLVSGVPPTTRVRRSGRSERAPLVHVVEGAAGSFTGFTRFIVERWLSRYT